MSKSRPAERARAIGVYYTIHNLLIVPAGTIGGNQWTHDPQAPLQVTGVVGGLGLIAFLITSPEGEDEQPK